MASKAPYHVILYSLVLGGSAFQSFVAAPVARQVLDRRQFGALQNKMFPGYFISQSVAPLLVLLTAPFALGTTALVSLGVSSAGGLVNYFVLLPWTQRVKESRYALEDANHHQTEGGEPTLAMKALNSEFGRSHGLSLVFNMTSIVSLVVYGVSMTRGLMRFVPK